MYVQRKATLLRERYGWPGSCLTEILCYVETGERHAILRVTNPADANDPPLVLDYRFPDIVPMYPPRPGYRYEAQQIAGTTQFEAIS